MLGIWRGDAMNPFIWQTALPAAVLTSAIMVAPAEALTASPGSLTFTVQQGGGNPNSQIVRISKDNARRVGWASSDNAAWLSVTPNSGQMTSDAEVEVTVNTSSLNAGTYTGSIKIAAKKGGSVTIPVTLKIIASVSASPSQVSSTSATLTWVANSESDLAGYKVYVGMAPGAYGAPIAIGNITSYMVSNLLRGNTYYFAVSAYDKSGNESALSTVVSKSIY
jgi:hypothetical protein